MDDIEIYHLSNGYTFFQYKHILLYLLYYICVCLHTHTYMKREYVYTHIYTHFKWSYPTQQIMSLLEAIGFQIESRGKCRPCPQALGHRFPRDSRNNTGCCHSSWQGPIAEDTTHFDHRSWRNQVDTDQEVSSLLASFHSTGRDYIGCWRRKMSAMI